MYAVLAKNLKEIYPKYNHRLTNQHLLLVEELRKNFEFKKSDEENPWTSNVGLVSIASGEEKRYWKESKNEHIKFYLKLNPNFQTGNGLVTLIPFSWKNIFLSSFRVTGYILKKMLKPRV